MNSWIVPALIVVALLVVWKAWTAYRSPEQLRGIAAALRAGAPLIDVRTAMEFDAGHLLNAKNLPLTTLGREAEQLGDKKSPIVVYCASGTRSGHAAVVLRKAGFEQVLDLGPIFNGRKLSKYLPSATDPSEKIRP